MALTEQLTLDEFLLRPEEKPALEYERGKVSQKLEPDAWHGKLQGEVAFLIERHGRSHGRVSSFIETRITWRAIDVAYVPDASTYLVDRVPIDEDGYIANDLTVPPDVAVEVAAPGQNASAQMDRCRWYVAHGVRVSLLVHPQRRTVWTFRPGVESGPLQGADVVDLGDVIPGFSFVVEDLFAALRPGSG